MSQLSLNHPQEKYPDTQSSRLSSVGSFESTYLADVGRDFGGKRAEELGQRAAQRYLAGLECERVSTPNPGSNLVTTKLKVMGKYARLTAEVISGTLFPKLP